MATNLGVRFNGRFKSTILSIVLLSLVVGGRMREIPIANHAIEPEQSSISVPEEAIIKGNEQVQIVGFSSVSVPESEKSEHIDSNNFSVLSEQEKSQEKQVAGSATIGGPGMTSFTNLLGTPGLQGIASMLTQFSATGTSGLAGSFGMGSNLISSSSSANG